MPLRRRIDRVLIYLRRHGLAATVGEIAARVGRRATAGDLPASVHLEVSNCCNLRCEYCVLDENAQGDKIMSEQTFKAALPALAHARRIDLSGLAEPLMHKRFTAMLAEVRRVAPDAHIAMCTNATLLTPEISEQLIDNRLDELVFSLDGVDPRQVDEVRKGGSLDTVLRNIDALRRAKEARGATKPSVSATVVLQKDNVGQLPGIVRLAAELGCDGVSVNGLEPYGSELVGHVIWVDPTAVPWLTEALAEADAAAREVGIELRLPAMRPQAPLCPQAARPMILADGTVVPCSVLAYERRALLGVGDDRRVEALDGTTGALRFGNVKDGGLEAVWRSPAYREFRRAVARGDFPETCATCLMKHGMICATPPLSASESAATVRRP